MLDPATEAAYAQLADALARRATAATRTFVPVIGLCGAQGSGKSTAARWLAARLTDAHGLRTAIVALDDFYLPLTARQRLAAEVHPLLRTRGVPGTHEVELGCAVLDALRAGEPARWPRFDKARDDRAPPTADEVVPAPVQLVLFEGWCVGLPAQADAALAEPVNALERDEDPDGRWRRAVNARLAGDYAGWFARLDATVFLQVPDFDAIRRWRGQQERDTAASAAPGVSAAANALQSPAQLARFIAHYERLTRHALAVMPARAAQTLVLDDAHRVAATLGPGL